MKDVSLKNAKLEHKPTNDELLLGSVLFLITRYARHPDVRVAMAIEEHLDNLANYAGQDSAFMSNTCIRLKKQWKDIYINFSGSGELNPVSHKAITNTLIN